MIQEDKKKQIIAIWDKYIFDNKAIQDTKGKSIDNIDDRRLEAIKVIKVIISDFLSGKIDIREFKTDIDSYNKQNNLWGFTSIKGQMFFNLLVKTSGTEEKQKKLTKLLQSCITEPVDLKDALIKIDEMDKYTSNIFNKAPDKRKAPNPSSICYFLSYFWQIHDYQKWPIMYSSIVTSFSDIGLWTEQTIPKDVYQIFYKLNEEIKGILTIHAGRAISNWEEEHAFWNYRTIKSNSKQLPKPKEDKHTELQTDNTISALKEASFNIYDFIPPVTSKLIELGSNIEISGPAKGVRFGKLVCEVFKQIGFSIEPLGQGSGRDPDLIARYKEDHVAFIIDAKAYSNGYTMSAGDDRAIREYISHYCPKLQKEGIRKIGFLIVSNLFKPGFDTFINEMTWKTDVKRFSLLNSDALLHLLAYKIKDQLPMSEIIDAIINSGINITAQSIIQKFDDF